MMESHEPKANNRTWKEINNSLVAVISFCAVKIKTFSTCMEQSLFQFTVEFADIHILLNFSKIFEFHRLSLS